MLQRMMVALLALAALGALAPAAPALALAAKLAAPASCDRPGAACAQQPMCKPVSALGAEHALTPAFSAAIAEPDWRERALPLTRRALAPDAFAAQSGPPAYLRFHRFLL